MQTPKGMNHETGLLEQDELNLVAGGKIDISKVPAYDGPVLL